MAGIEDIVGKTGNYHVRDRFKRFDNKFIRPLILKHVQVWNILAWTINSNNINIIMGFSLIDLCICACNFYCFFFSLVSYYFHTFDVIAKTEAVCRTKNPWNILKASDERCNGLYAKESINNWWPNDRNRINERTFPKLSNWRWKVGTAIFDEPMVISSKHSAWKFPT